ncbi:MAG: type I-C CRISPR-associated protein Cas5 [Planctomycetaceae bacterium]|nr:type I-C CRISPR-associated protein Cas5 [Planctomycetaceae bacterium]
MNKPSPIRLKVWGLYACFTRPEMKVERVSYDVITPSAARGVLEAIYWKPQVRWVVERLHVLKPIRFTSLRRNEVASKASAANAKKAMNGKLKDPLALFIEDDRQQRAATILRDVAYVIEARFELLDHADPVEKHYNIFKRRAERGQYFHHPYLGCREFVCDFDWIDGPIPESELTGEQDLGYLLHDIEFASATGKSYDTVSSHDGQKLKAIPHFFRATMRNGVIDVPPLQPSLTPEVSR